MYARKDLGVRPKCSCGKDCQFVGSYKKDGTPSFRKTCPDCHQKSIAKKHGVRNIKHVIAKNSGLTITEYHRKMLESAIKNNGFSNRFELFNSRSKYKKYRKDYCENAKGPLAGWLGYKCTAKIVHPYIQLDADHIDGNPSNNSEDNIMTLCKCCHSIKSNMFMDYATPGRKALGVI